MARLGAAIGAAALLVAATDADACQWQRNWRFYWGQLSEIKAVTPRGRPCGTSIRFSGAPIETVRIVARPRGGVAGVSTISIAYKPNDGFVGSDQFTFEVFSRHGRRGSPETATVRVLVTVTP